MYGKIESLFWTVESFRLKKFLYVIEYSSVCLDTNVSTRIIFFIPTFFSDGRMKNCLSSKRFRNENRRTTWKKEIARITEPVVKCKIETVTSIEIKSSRSSKNKTPNNRKTGDRKRKIPMFDGGGGFFVRVFPNVRPYDRRGFATSWNGVLALNVPKSSKESAGRVIWSAGRCRRHTLLMCRRFGLIESHRRASVRITPAAPPRKYAYPDGTDKTTAA